MKVLRVIGGVDPRFGGPSASSLASALGARRAGIETTVVFPVDDVSHPWVASAVSRLRDAEIEVETFSLSAPRRVRSRRLGASLGLAAWVLRRAGRYDLVHAHGAWTLTTLVAVAAGRLHRTPTVLTPHESLVDYDLEQSASPKRIVKRALRRAYLRTVDLLVFSSALEERDSGPPARRSVVIAHPVDEPFAAAGKEHSPGERLVVGFLGRLDPKKNVDVLLEAVSMVDGVELRIASAPGNDEGALRKRTLRPDLAGRVEWLGFVQAERKASFFAGVDLVALPSRYECFGMAAAEAVVHGVPVVVGRTTGVAELVERHACGVAVDPEANALAEVFARLAADRDTLVRLSRATRAAAAELTPERHGAELGRAYSELLHHHSTATGTEPARKAAA